MDAAVFLFDDARQRLAAGDRPGAIARLQESLAVHPPQFEARSLLANLLYEAGAHAAAIEALTIATLIAPERTHAHAALGRWLLHAGRAADAIAPLERAARTAPATETWRDLSRAYAGTHQLERAQECLAAAWRLDPNDDETWRHYVAFQLEHDRPDSAAEELLTPCAITPAPRQAWLMEQVYHYFRTGHYRAARRLTAYLVACDPVPPLAASMHWLCLAQAEDVTALLAFEPLIEPIFRAALPAQPWLRRNLVWHLFERGDRAGALAETAILIQEPLPAEVAEQCAHVLLAYAAPAPGWDMLKRIAIDRNPPGLPPHWRGEAGPGLRLLITNPDGLGDFLQFGRYIPTAAARCQVILQIQPTLHRLAATIAQGLRIAAPGMPVEADYHCTAASLAAILYEAAPLRTIPVPYIHADAVATAAWQSRLAAHQGVRVGIAWQGSHKPFWDYKRSLAPERFAALAAIPGVTLFSLQFDNPAPAFMQDVMGQCADMADTAALIAALDLVITVDTSIVHLAGAIGKPVWLLNFAATEWRWRMGRSSPADPTPWYPHNLREFRQPNFGDWASVLAAVAAALRDLAAQTL